MAVVRVLEADSASPARFNPEKLAWLNAQYLKRIDEDGLAAMTEPFLRDLGCDTQRGPSLSRVVTLLRERVNTVRELADAAVYFYQALEPSAELKKQQ